MARLWIANTTKQRHTFVYRPKISDGGVKDGIQRPMYGELRQLPIPVGGQICIGEDSKLSDGEIRNILDQHKHVLNFDELKNARGYHGLCYRIGQDPVPIERIMETIESNDKARTDVAKDRQQQTALEIANRMRAVSAEEGAPMRDLREVDVQVAQAPAEGVNKGTPQLNDVVEVVEPGKEPSQRGRKNAG